MVIILDSDLRLHAVRNNAWFKDKNQALPLYARIDLYDEDEFVRVQGLKIDLAPRLSPSQAIYVVTYFEQSKNMLLQSYTRVVLQFDFDDQFYREGKLFADNFNLERTEL